MRTIYFTLRKEKVADMCDSVKNYTLANWEKYNLVNSHEEMVKLLNILEAHGESIETLHEAENEFCGISRNGGNFENDKDTVRALYEFNEFYADKEEFYEIMIILAEDAGLSVSEFMEDEDIRETADGIVRVLHY